MNFIKVLLALIGLILLGFHAGRAGEQDSPPVRRTNLEIIQDLLHEISSTIADRSKFGTGDTIEVHVTQQQDSWIVENAFNTALRTFGCVPYTHPTSEIRVQGHRLEIGPTDIRVEYDNMIREGLFGKKNVRRTIVISLSYQALRLQNGEIVSSDVFKKQFVDTVAVDNVATLEHSAAKSTQGELPAEQFIDKIVEPFVIIGATGIIVYLFFHIRS